MTARALHAYKSALSVLRQVDKGQLKVLYSTLQIVSTVSWNLNVVFPPPFSDLLGVFSFVQLDWLSLDCATGKSSFFNRVIVASVGPILLVAAIVVVGALRITGSHIVAFCSFLCSRGATKRSSSGNGTDGGGVGAAEASDEHRQRVFSQHANACLLLTYLVLVCSTKIIATRPL